MRVVYVGTYAEDYPLHGMFTVKIGKCGFKKSNNSHTPNQKAWKNHEIQPQIGLVIYAREDYQRDKNTRKDFRLPNQMIQAVHKD